MFGLLSDTSQEHLKHASRHASNGTTAVVKKSLRNSERFLVNGITAVMKKSLRNSKGFLQVGWCIVHARFEPWRDALNFVLMHYILCILCIVYKIVKWMKVWCWSWPVSGSSTPILYPPHLNQYQVYIHPPNSTYINQYSNNHQHAYS